MCTSWCRNEKQACMKKHHMVKARSHHKVSQQSAKPICIQSISLLPAHEHYSAWGLTMDHLHVVLACAVPQIELPVSLEDLYKGLTKKLKVSRGSERCACAFWPSPLWQECVLSAAGLGILCGQHMHDAKPSNVSAMLPSSWHLAMCSDGNTMWFLTAICR